MITDDEIKMLEADVKKARFILSQKAAEMHDLVEDRIPKDYLDIPVYAEDLYNACKKWDEYNQKLHSIKKKV